MSATAASPRFSPMRMCEGPLPTRGVNGDADRDWRLATQPSHSAGCQRRAGSDPERTFRGLGRPVDRRVALSTGVKSIGLYPHPFRHAFPDHDAGQVGVGARDGVHNRGISNPEPGDTVHAPMLVHDGVRVACRPHAGGATGWT